MKRLYTVPSPIPMRDSLMTSPDFYVPLSDAGYKVAAWLDNSTREQRLELFKIAVEKDTRDLAQAYNTMCNAGEKVDTSPKPPVDDDDDDDYGQNTFYEGGESNAED